MRPRSGCPLQVSLQHGATLLDRDLFESHSFGPSVTRKVPAVADAPDFDVPWVVRWCDALWIRAR
jgi:hypothetical protein